MSLLNGDVTRKKKKDMPTTDVPLGGSCWGDAPTQRPPSAPLLEKDGAEFCSTGSFNSDISIAIDSGFMLLILKEVFLL